MKVVIVIPTYNEGENMSQLLPILQTELEQIKNHTCHILVMDGNSTDSTKEIVTNFSVDHPNVHLVVETKKEGIGAAYMKGFRKAMHDFGADVLIEMDGDLQHDPKDIKRLLAEIDSGYDYVIGSRFVDGGSLPKEWELIRKIFSIGGSLFARIVLGVWSVKDFTTGYKASRVKGFVDQIDFTQVMSSSFAYKIDLLYRMYKLGAKIKEIPIEFGLRDRGESKIESGTLMDSVRVVLLLRVSENKSFYKFLITGTIGMFVDFTFANLLKFAEIRAGFAAITAALIAMLTTFSLNNNWSFKAKKISGPLSIIKNLAFYLLSSSVPIFLRFSIVETSIRAFGDNYLVYNLALIVSIAIGITWNYFVYSRLIWKTKKIK